MRVLQRTKGRQPLVENHNVFAGAFVDRSGERRKDTAWLAEAAISEGARFVPVWGSRCLVGGDPPHALRLLRSQLPVILNSASPHLHITP